MSANTGLFPRASRRRWLTVRDIMESCPEGSLWAVDAPHGTAQAPVRHHHMPLSACGRTPREMWNLELLSMIEPFFARDHRDNRRHGKNLGLREYHRCAFGTFGVLLLRRASVSKLGRCQNLLQVKGRTDVGRTHMQRSEPGRAKTWNRSPKIRHDDFGSRTSC